MSAILNEIQHVQTQDYVFTVEIKGFDPETFKVTAFDWTETLSQLYSGSIQLASREFRIKLNEAIDKQVTLKIRHKYDSTIRHYHGVVESMSALGEDGHWALYSITVMPLMHRMNLTSDARIFQNITVPDIVKQILIEQGIQPFEFRLKDKRLEREYCVQYRETHLAFVERILAEEGIFHFWEHNETEAKLIFTDLTQLANNLEASPTLEYNNRASGTVKGGYIQSFQWKETVRSTTLRQRDYSFHKPYYDQEHETYRARENGEHPEYLLYNAYGRYKESDSGNRFTQYSIESIRNDASLGVGSSNAMHLMAGHRFTLTDHDQVWLNRKYLLVSVHHQGQQPQAMEEHAGSGGTFYSNQFQVFAESGTSWRPPQKYKPVIDGPQMAHVVGPAGEEIYCDEYGRVKVHFPWDRYSKKNEQSSCWIRVAQTWAGRRWGAIAIPRIGHEVIVDFIEGDPDQPIIIGRTYHADNLPPYDLPANKTQTGIKTRSSKDGDATNFNEIRFEDKKGQEQVYIHAEKNQDNVVENDETTKVGHDRTETVGNNETITIGQNRTETVGANETITIKASRTENVSASETISIGGSRTENVGGNETITITGKREETIKQTQTLTVTSDITIESLSGGITLKTAGGSIVIKNDGDILISGKLVDVDGSDKITLN